MSISKPKNTAASVSVVLALLLSSGCGEKAPTQAEKVAEYLDEARDWYEESEYDKAIAAYSEAIRLDKTCAVAYYNRGSLWTLKGQNEKAIADYKQAMRLDPKYADALYRLGRGWFNKGEYEKAIAAYNEAIRMDPERADARAYYYRGNAFDKTGQYAKALADYRQAVGLDADYALPHFSLAELFSSCPKQKYRDGRKAVENATRACELTEWKDWPVLEALAAAYAEAGDFAKAIEWQTKAVDLAAESEKTTQRKKKLLRYRLDLYKAGKPFRQDSRAKQTKHRRKSG